MKNYFDLNKIKEVAQKQFESEKNEYNTIEEIETRLNELKQTIRDMNKYKEEGKLENYVLPPFIEKGHEEYLVEDKYKLHHALWLLENNMANGFYELKEISIFKEPLYIAYKQFYLLKPYLESKLKELYSDTQKEENFKFESFGKLFNDALHYSTELKQLIGTLKGKYDEKITIELYEELFKVWLQKFKNWEPENENKYKEYLRAEIFKEFILHEYKNREDAQMAKIKMWENNNEVTGKYNLNSLNSEISKLNTVSEKLKYLIEIKAEFLNKKIQMEKSITLNNLPDWANNTFLRIAKLQGNDLDFDKICDIEIDKIQKLSLLKNDNSPEPKPEQGEQKIKKVGRKKVNAKPLNEYFINLEKERIPVFIEKLKNEFINSEPKEFVYMIKALVKLKFLHFACNAEIYRAFEKEFGKFYGTDTNKNNHLKAFKNEFQDKIEKRILDIKQSNTIY